MVVFAFSSPIRATTIKPLPQEKKISQKDAFKFFDLNHDKILNWHERGLFLTYQRFGWMLADDKEKKFFDTNGDWMLDPFEAERYQNRKQTQKAQKARRKAYEKDNESLKK